jgi:hypothetical protein
LKQLGWLLMLIPFGVVLGMLGFFFLYVLHQRRRREASDDPSGVLALGTAAGRPSVFEKPSRWLAVKSSNPEAIQAALNLQHAVPCSWEDSLSDSRVAKLFVSRPISGWVLVVGPGLPDPADDVDHCYRLLRDLSRKLGNVQFYCANRVLNHHAWALLEDGIVYRAYAWAGETLWNEGFVTAAERELGMVCFDYGHPVDAFGNREALATDTEKVNPLAARWSLDPAAIPHANWRAQGIVGEVSQARLY